MEQKRLRCNKCGKEFKQEKSIIKEDYSILNEAYEYFEEMRREALGSEELEEDNSCIREAYEYYKELHKIEK